MTDVVKCIVGGFSCGLTALVWCVQWLVCLYEQETIVTADWDKQVVVDLCCLDMKSHLRQSLVHLVRKKLHRKREKFTTGREARRYSEDLSKVSSGCPKTTMPNPESDDCLMVVLFV